MATNIFNFDGTLLTTVADGAIDTTHASIKFPGKGFQNYGEPVLENLLWIMQNFSGTTAPAYPSKGQLWYDTTSGSEILKIWTGTQWTIAGGVISSATDPGPGASQGAFWYDTTNKQLKTWNGTSWDIVGPLGSKINSDVLDPAKPVNSVIEAMRVNAVEDGLPRQIWRISIGGTMLAILSKDAAFTPQSSILTSNGFAKIYPGLNFSTTVTDASVAGDPTIFKSTQNNIPNLDSIYDLGTASKKFRTIYGSTGRFLTGLGVGSSYSIQNRFQVTGNSRFDGTVNLGPGTASTVPIKFNAAPVVPVGSEQLGAVEFDGNNFYFTSLLGGIPTRRVPLFGADITAGKVIYVSDLTGNDTNDGRTRNTAYKTIKKALDYLVSTTPYKEGYTIFVETGEYLEQNPLFVPARTSIVGDNLRRVIIRPVHNQLDLFHVEQGTYFFGMTFKDHRAPAFCFSFPCSTATAVISGGSIQEIKYMYSQSGYDPANPPTVFIEPPAFNSSGTRAEATAEIVDNAIIDVIVTNGGSGYSLAPGETTATIDPATTGGGQGAEFSVRTNNLGQVVAVDVVNPGRDYGDNVVLNIIGSGTSATVRIVKGNGVIRRFNISNPGSGYNPNRPPHISIKGINPPFVASSPYVQNCSSITGPFDTQGKLITTVPPYDIANPGNGYTAVDPNGAGAGLRIDGELLSNSTVVKSFVADSFTQFNQGGIGHLIINKGYTQFVSCFTTFSSIGYWARSGGFANISNSVIDFGNYGIQAEGYYPVPYTTGSMNSTFYSVVSGVNISDSGYGYDVSQIPITFSGGLDETYANKRNASGYAVVENSSVVSIIITDPGEGYTGDPTNPIFVSLTIDPGEGGRSAIIVPEDVELQPPATFQIDQLPGQNENIPYVKPQFGSGILYNEQFYIIKRVDPVIDNTNSWIIQTAPPIWSAKQGSKLYFHDISNISTGGLALEYVGSGITYNSLPVYGGNPIKENQVRDGETTSEFYPGRVYYVTIDNSGDFNVGPYFSVNFIDGSVKLNANAFELTNLVKIGPFRRNGVSVGTYANEISYDPSMTHLVNAADYDMHTIPTQSAVRGYFEQIKSNVYPNTTNFYSIGSQSKKWSNIVATSGFFSTVGIGTTTLTNAVNVYGDTTDAIVDVISNLGYEAKAQFVRYSDDISGPSLDFRKARGQLSTPTPVEGDDEVGTVKFIGRGTDNFVGSAQLVAKVDTEPGLPVSTSYVPTRLHFNTTDIGGTLAERVTILSNGSVGIATTVPETKLHIEGDVTVKNGEIRGFLSPFADSQFRAISGNYGVLLLNDGTTFRLLQTESSETPELATYNSYRPFEWNLSTGIVTINSTGEGVVFGSVATPTTLTLNGALNATGTLSTTGAITASGQVQGNTLKATNGLTVAGGANIEGTTTITGELRVTLDIIGFYGSDKRLKTNILPIADALEKVKNLNGVTFNWATPEKDQTQREAGVIAQDVQTVLPETVTTRENGYLAVDYPKLVPLLIEAIKELTARVEELEKRQ